LPVRLIPDDLGKHPLSLSPSPKNSITCSISELTTCREADHLFLVVPLHVTRTYGPENVYSRVVSRMKTFVMPENEVNVASIGVFGY
jgi:hypothetical protein